MLSSESDESKEIFSSSHGKLSPSTLPPGPPEAEVEDTFLGTHPPNSHLFPVRGRSNSSPTARPSSLSRLLAQASPASDNIVTENPPIPAPEIKRSPSPPFSPPPPPSPSLHTGSAPQSVNTNAINHSTAPSPSPLRPGSRASRLSTTSRFSVGRIPALGTVASSQPSKAAPTTAITDQIMAESPSGDNPFRSPVTPSPEESITDAISNTMNNQGRHRAASYKAAKASPLASNSSQGTVVPPSDSPVAARPPSIVTSNAFANLASNWGVPFGRKKKAEQSGSGSGNLTPTVESPLDASASDQRVPATTDANSTARDLLRRF